MDSKKMLKMALISGAAHALKLKKKGGFVTDDEILQQLNRDSEELISKLNSSF